MATLPRKLAMRLDTSWKGPGEMWIGRRHNLTTLSVWLGKPHEATVFDIAVRRRRRGTGSAVLHELEHWLIGRRIQLVHGWSLDPAIPFWKRMGYRVNQHSFFKKRLSKPQSFDS